MHEPLFLLQYNHDNNADRYSDIDCTVRAAHHSYHSKFERFRAIFPIILNNL
jgi:hypothetical protein